jgi:putative phosphoribosyl transferase
VFEDRKDAGKQLAKALDRYKNRGVLVLAIPRGGVEIGYEVARHLDADFAILISRKLPYPDNPEAGFGAVAEDGSKYIIREAGLWLGRHVIDKIIEEQKREIIRRIKVLRNGRPLPEIEGRTIILVDDGMAVGSTMRAGIMLCKERRAGFIVVASPVCDPGTAEEIGQLVDEVEILEKPKNFRAVAQVYRNWYDVSDEEVEEIMKRWGK